MVWVARERKLVFYVDNTRVAGREPDWVQAALLVIVYTFCRVRLEKNLDKIKAMVFTPGFIWVQIGEYAYKRRSTGEGVKCRERKRMRVSCSECGALMADSSLRHYIRRSHGVIPP